MSGSLLFVVLVLAAPPSFSDQPKVVDERRARIRMVFGLQAPYLIVNWGPHEDGGSISGYVKDAEGNKLMFSIASQRRVIPVVQSAERMRAMTDSILAIPTNLYIGHYQSNPDAEKLELGSEREKALLDLLEFAAVDELGSSMIAHLDYVLATADEPSARSRFFEELPENASVPFRAHLMVAGLRKERRQHVVGWDDN